MRKVASSTPASGTIRFNNLAQLTRLGFLFSDFSAPLVLPDQSIRSNTRPKKEPAMNADKQEKLNQDYADFLVEHATAKAQSKSLGNFLSMDATREGADRRRRSKGRTRKCFTTLAPGWHPIICADTPARHSTHSANGRMMGTGHARKRRTAGMCPGAQVFFSLAGHGG